MSSVRDLDTDETEVITGKLLCNAIRSNDSHYVQALLGVIRRSSGHFPPDPEAQQCVSELIVNGLSCLVPDAIASGAVCTIVDKNWSSPLHLACKFGETEVVPVLLQNGCVRFLFARDAMGHLPIDYAYSVQPRTPDMAIVIDKLYAMMHVTK